MMPFVVEPSTRMGNRLQPLLPIFDIWCPHLNVLPSRTWYLGQVANSGISAPRNSHKRSKNICGQVNNLNLFRASRATNRNRCGNGADQMIWRESKMLRACLDPHTWTWCAYIRFATTAPALMTDNQKENFWRCLICCA